VINEGLPDEWPPEVVSAALLFQQGDLVKKPPFFYVGSAKTGVWKLTSDLGDPNLPDEIFELDPESAPEYGMISTETCDLTEEGRRPKQPWISVAPVYKISPNLDPNQIDLLNGGRVSYLRPVRCEQLPDSIWVVDARIEFPIEKSWLVGREPVHVYKTDEQRAEIARFFAGRHDRPVLSDALHKALITPMRRWLESLRPERRSAALGGIAEVRLAVAGSPLDPDGVGIILIAIADRVPDAARNEWEAKWKNWRSRMENVEIALLANAYETYDSLSARGYRESLPVSLDLDF
jgi:hypothetical protein